jgi:hypothetical protein
VVRPADPPEEERDDLVAHDLVDEAVVSKDRVGGQPIEAIEERVKVGRAQTFTHRRRAADIREEQRDRNLDAAHALFAKLGQAFGAEGWIAGGTLESSGPHDEAADSGERRSAQLAAWRGGDPSECSPPAC